MAVRGGAHTLSGCDKALSLVRRTITCGPISIALSHPAGLAASMRWLDSPGKAAEVELTLHPLGATLVEPPAQTAGDRSAEPYNGKYIRGWLAPDGGVGEFALVDGGEGLSTAASELHSVKEAAFVAALEVVLRRGGAMLHACAVRVGDFAWIVCGQSGAGKSTLAGRLESRWLGDEWIVVVPDERGAWHWWRWAQWRLGVPEQPWTLPLGGIAGLTPDRSQTACRPATLAEATGVATAAMFWLPWWSRKALLDRAFEIVAGNCITMLSHSLQTPPDQLVAALAAAQESPG